MPKSMIVFYDREEENRREILRRRTMHDDDGEPRPSYNRNHEQEDVNDFMKKKTLAQGFLDFALFAANAAQLHRVIVAGTNHRHYYFLLLIIVVSILLQVFQAVLMCILGIFLDMNIKSSHPKLIITNNVLLLTTSLSVAINVLISAFDLAE